MAEQIAAMVCERSRSKWASHNVLFLARASPSFPFVLWKWSCTSSSTVSENTIHRSLFLYSLVDRNFIACVSGFLIRGPRLSWEANSESKAAIAAPEYGFTLSTPVLHVVGRNDIVVPMERSRIFVQHSRFNRVEEHNGGEFRSLEQLTWSRLNFCLIGHFIPMQQKWAKFFISFLSNPFGNISSPTPPLPTSTSHSDEDFITPLQRIETYQTGRSLPYPDDDRDIVVEEQEEQSYIFSVVYDSGSDSESESDNHPSPPDTPYLRTPQLPVLELDDAGIVDSGMSSRYGYDHDAVVGLFPPVLPVLGHMDVELVKSKLWRKGLDGSERLNDIKMEEDLWLQPRWN